MPRAARRRGEIVLASGSPRRVALLASAGIAASVVPSGVPERARAGETAVARVRRLAEAKARSVARRHPGRFFVGADTIVVLDGEVMGKPRSRRDAERMLRRLSARTHEVITGYAVYDRDRDRIHVGAARTRVQFRRLRQEEIAAHVAAETDYDKAGGYAIQGSAAYMVARIEGSYTNVVGLPLGEVREALVRMGAATRASRRRA